MNIQSFQLVCGVTVLITHVVAVALIANAARYADIREQITSVLIVLPIAAVYASAFLRYVAAIPRPTRLTGPVDRFAAATMYLVVAVLCAGLLYTVIKFVYFSSYPVAEFNIWLGLSETAFGVLTGMVFERFFGVQPEPVQAK